MEKYISAIEVSDTEVRLAVGYVKNNKVNLIHVAERPIRGLVSHGEIVDFQTLSSIIASMKEFKDETTKEKITINEVTLVLPSLGLNVFQSVKTSNIVSPYSQIAQIDIENVVSLVQKEAIPCGSEIGLEINRALSNDIHFKMIGASTTPDHGRFVYKNYIEIIIY